MNKLRKLIFSFVCITSLVAVSGCSNLIEDLKPKVIDTKQFSASELGLTGITKVTVGKDLIVSSDLLEGKNPTEDDVVVLKNWGYGDTTIYCYGPGEGADKEVTVINVSVQKDNTIKYNIKKNDGEIENITWEKKGSTEREISAVTMPDGTEVNSTKETTTSKKSVNTKQNFVTKNLDGTVETREIISTENKDGSYQIVNHVIVVDINEKELSNKTETVEMSSDGEYSEKSTEVSKDVNSNKVETTKERIVHKDESETSKTEEIVYDAEDKEIKKVINSITKNTEGNVLDSRVYQLDEDGSYSDYNFKLNDDGSKTESNESKKADGSEEKIAETKDEDDNVILSTKYIKNADGSYSDYKYKVGNDGSSTESSESVSKEKSQKESVVKDKNGNEIASSKEEIVYDDEGNEVSKIIKSETKDSEGNLLTCKDYVLNEDKSSTDYEFKKNDDGSSTEKKIVVDSEGFEANSVVIKDSEGKLKEIEFESTHELEEFILKDMDGDFEIPDEYKDCITIDCDDDGIVTFDYHFTNPEEGKIEYMIIDSEGYKARVIVSIDEDGNITEEVKPVPSGLIKINFEELLPCLKINQRDSVLTVIADTEKYYVLSGITWYKDGVEVEKGETLDVSAYESGRYYIVVTDGEAYGAYILEK